MRHRDRRSSWWRREERVGVAVAGGIVLLVILMVFLQNPGDAQPSAAGLRLAGLGNALIAAAGDQDIYVLACAHVGGAAGTDWRTDMEVHNPGTLPAAFTIALLERGAANTSPQTQSFNLAAGQSVRYTDVLSSMFGFSGAAVLRISATQGVVTAVSRTYNQVTNGTYGQFIGGLPALQAIGTGEHGRIVQLTHNRAAGSGFRTNIGLANVTGTTVVVRVALYSADGRKLGQADYTLSPYMYVQIDRIFESMVAGDVEDGYAVISTTTAGGRFLAYASVIDNRTGDPIYIPAARLSGAPPTVTPGTPQPTSTPTRTPTPTATQPGPTPTPTTTPQSATTNLKPYAPAGWSGPVVVSGQTGTTTSGDLVGGAPTYIDWCIANYGPGDAFFPLDTYVARVGVEGTGSVDFGWQDAHTLAAGYYTTYEDYQIDDVPAGQHTVTLTADPGSIIPETDEDDNQTVYTGSWSVAAGAAQGTAAAHEPARATIRVLPIPPDEWKWALAHQAQHSGRVEGVKWPAASRSARRGTGAAVQSLVTGTVYIPAAAHVTGAAGTDWRTDVELHNPGATAVQVEIALLSRDQANPSPQIATYTVPAGQSLRLSDVLQNVFSFSGAAALRVTPTGGSLLVTSRTFNQTSGGTYGQFIGSLAVPDFITPGKVARIIQLTQTPGGATGSRTNLGLLNTTGSDLTVMVELRRADGTALGTFPVALGPFMYVQLDQVFQRVTASEVSDGYVLLSTSTPGGAFLAYASVVDNRTGDPVCIFPTASTVVTPPPPSHALGITEALDQIFDQLDQLGTGDLPDFEQFVAQDQANGFYTHFDQYVQAYPGIVSRSGDHLLVDFGPGTLLEDGTVIGGHVSADVTHIDVSPTRFAFDYSADAVDMNHDGTYPIITEASGSVSLDVDGSGHVRGSMSINGSGPEIQISSTEHSISTITGTADIDSAVCPRYPVGGTITLTYGGETHLVTFTPNCDGEYVYQGPGQTGDIAFRLTWSGPQDLDLYVKEPNGEVIYYGNPQSATGGKLDVDSNAGCSSESPSPTENIFWPVGQAPHGTYEVWADRYSSCSASPTPAYTLRIFVGDTVVQTINGTISSGGDSQHVTYAY